MLKFLVLLLFFEACCGVEVEISPTNLTRIVASSAEFEATITNLSNETISFIWYVDGRSVADVNYSNGSILNITKMTGYSILSNTSDSENLTIKLTIDNVVFMQNPTEIRIDAEITTANATLNTREECSLLPDGILSPSCSDLLCNATSEPQLSRGVGIPDSPVLYSCFNVTICEENAQWSQPSLNCNQTPVGCDVVGKWGLDCTNDCSEGCSNPEVCNFTDGGCSCGSTSGYTGYSCNELDDTPCAAEGFWGQSCDLHCGEGCPFSTCHRISGQCTNEAQEIISKSAMCNRGFIGLGCNDTGCETGVWGPNCTMVCGNGCPSIEENQIGSCNIKNGSCGDDGKNCSEGYSGSKCDTAICDPQDCNGGECVAPGLCQRCPLHFASGETCRNIRLDGFLKGSLSTFAILTAVIIFFSFTSKWYIRRKIKVKNH